MNVNKINGINKFGKQFNRLQLRGKQNQYIKIYFYRGIFYFKHYIINGEKQQLRFEVVCKKENEQKAFNKIFEYIEALRNE